MLHLQLCLAVVLLATTSMLAAPALPPPPQLPGCKESCGGVSIPYPFGLTDGCYLYVPGQDSQQFKLACNTTATPPSILFLDSSNFTGRIANIFNEESALQVMAGTARSCNNDTEYSSDTDRGVVLLFPSSYTIADTNMIYNLGCNRETLIGGFPHNNVTDGGQAFITAVSGFSLCLDVLGDALPEKCNGFGCSVSPIPSGLRNASVFVMSMDETFDADEKWALGYPCSYGFIVDERNFTFAGNRSFDELHGKTQELPVLVSWAIGDDNCTEAKNKNETAFACNGVKTECVDRDPGYFCKCVDGYRGNPYLLNDCTDIDECKNSTICSGIGRCENRDGSYQCMCDKKIRNDDNSKKCINTKGTSGGMKYALGVCLGFLVLVSLTFFIYHIMKKRKFEQLCARYAKENGGTLISEELLKYEGLGYKAPRTFKLQELNDATNKFHVGNLIGEGSFGKVYKGTLPGDKKGTKLPENKEVAIKKCKGEAPTMSPESKKAHAKQFINEMILLTGIQHRNVVTLLGFCLETKTPILVYELVKNGTLHEHIHKINKKGPLSFVQRIRIAAETAASLAYLHYNAFATPIVHRDVKTSNILLDENLTAKVSDFGASKLIPEDETTQVATLVQGTLGYLDPTYIQTHQLTEKSDVYSFGVVLVEMLTSQKATDPHKKLEMEKNLSYCFLMSLKESRLDEILDGDIIDEETFDIAEQVAKLAQRCLSLAGDERPTMKEVEAELQAILVVLVAKNPGEGGKLKASHRETDYLLAASPSNAFVVDIRSDEGEAIRSIDYDKSMQNQAVQMTRPGGR